MTQKILLTVFAFFIFLLSLAQEQNTHRCNDRCRSLGGTVTANNLSTPALPVVASAASITCPLNIDFELGSFTRWQTNIGTVDTVINLTDTSNIINLPAGTWLGNANTPPSPQRQVLMDRLVGGIDYYGQFPVNPPNRGGRYALKLGSDEDALDAPAHGYPNKKAESARYIVNVPNPANDYSITFSYAVVLENPDGTTGGSGGGGGGTPNIHQNFAQPRFRVRMYDANTGELVPCANFDFVADETLPGFFNSIHSYEHRPDAAVKCKAWSEQFVNLSRYAGRTLYLEFTTADCTYGGHFGYAYVDVVECGLNASGLYHCDNQTATMTGPPGFQNYTWYSNDYSNQVGTGQVIDVVNTTPGSNYWCVVTPYNNTGCAGCVCKDTLGVKVVAVYPVADAGNPAAVCFTDSLQIGSVNVPSYNYSWSPATGLSSSTIASPMAAPSGITDYIVTVTDTLTHCQKKDTVRISLYPRPAPAFTVDDNMQCMPGHLFTFTDNSVISGGALSRTWYWGDGTTANISPVTHSYATNGTYRVKLLVQSDHGCIDSAFRNVYVYEQPNAAFNLNTSNACLTGNNIVFQSTPTIAGSQYQWTLGDGTTFTGQNPPAHHYTSTGSYTITLTVTSNNGCVDTVNHPLQIHALPVVNLISTEPPVICSGDSIKLTAIYSAVEGTVQSVQWFQNGSLLPNITDSVLMVTQQGDYSFQITNSWGCSLADTLAIVVNNLPSGDLQTPASSFICEDANLILSATGGDYYQWFFNGSPIQDANSAQYIAVLPGLYSVDIFNSDGCHISANHPANLNMVYRPDARFNYQQSCERIPILFNNQSQVANSGNVTWQWSVDSVPFSTQYQPSYSFTQAGNYAIQLVANSSDCPQLTDTASLSLIIVPNPGGVRYPPVDVVKYRNQQLEARSFGNIYSWSPTNGLNATGIRNPIFNYNRDVEYLIRLTDQYGCPVVDTQLVRVFGKGDIYVPNAFTPDRSGNANDYMYPILVGMIELRYFRIFDRWGRLMFESNKARPGWNGIFNGKPQPMDTYTWTVEAVDIDGRVITRSGNCVLIR